MSDIEYQIEYQIQRSVDGGDFEEIGFGSSGEWGDVDQAMHMAASAVQSREWETEQGQPSPEEVDR
ncbi:hypothetical protein ACI1US_01009 [Leucobacter sp. BZR 635]